MQSQMEAKLESQVLLTQNHHARFPFLLHLYCNTGTNPNSTSTCLSPDIANTVGKPTDAATTVTQQRTEPKASNAAYRISAPAPLAGSRSTTIYHTTKIRRVRVVPPAEHRPSRPRRWRAFRSPAPMVAPRTRSPRLLGIAERALNTPLRRRWPTVTPPILADGRPRHTQARRLYDRVTVPCLDSPENLRRVSEGHIPDTGFAAMTNAVTNNCVYGMVAIRSRARVTILPAAVCPNSLIEESLPNGSGEGGAYSDAQNPALSITRGTFWWKR